MPSFCDCLRRTRHESYVREETFRLPDQADNKYLEGRYRNMFVPVGFEVDRKAFGFKGDRVSQVYSRRVSVVDAVRQPIELSEYNAAKSKVTDKVFEFRENPFNWPWYSAEAQASVPANTRIEREIVGIDVDIPMRGCWDCVKRFFCIE